MCRRFFEGFKKGSRYVYHERLLALPSSSKKDALIIDFLDIESLLLNPVIGKETADLATFVIQSPGEAIEAFEEAARQIISESDPDFDPSKVRVRFKNIPIEVEIPDIRVEHVGKIVSTVGIVNMIETKGSIITKAVYTCECGFENTTAETRGLNHRPVTTCSSCDGHNLYLDDEASEKSTFQRISIQQMHDRVNPGAVAEDLEAWLVGNDLVNTVMPGERIRVTGFVRLKQKTGKRGDNSRFDFYIDVNSIQSLHDEEAPEADDQLMKEVENAIRDGHEEEDFQKLVNSICPTIKGEEDIKKAILLQLAGSEAVILPDGSRIRGDINILLCGDPGSSKTTFLRWVKRIPKRSVYVTGRGFSKAGLTAAVIREEGSLPKILAGAYMHGDRGIVCVDEIDKTNPEDREVLPSLMDDQQVFNLAKFGINKELAIRAASLHACNPIDKKYDITKTLSENLPFAGWLFDRYDLKFVLRNVPDEDKDNEVSAHTANMMLQGVSEKAIERKEAEPNKVEGVHDTKFMKAWVAYVRKTFDPKPTPEAMEYIRAYYRDLRSKESRVAEDITMREMGTLFRLARASARAHMRHVVTISDVQFGIDLLAASLRTYGIDPVTGELSGKFATFTPPDRKKLAKIVPTLKQLIRSLAGPDGKNMIGEAELIQKMQEAGFARADVLERLQKLYLSNKLYEPKVGYYMVVWSEWSRW